MVFLALDSYFRQLPNEVKRSCTVTVGSVMASKALSDQVAAKWQDSFNRLNRGAPGISGLMGFSRVRDLYLPLSLLFNQPRVVPFLSRPGQLLQMLCTPESLGRLRRTLVSVCTLSDALK